MPKHTHKKKNCVISSDNDDNFKEEKINNILKQSETEFSSTKTYDVSEIIIPDMIEQVYIPAPEILINETFIKNEVNNDLDVIAIQDYEQMMDQFVVRKLITPKDPLALTSDDDDMNDHGQDKLVEIRDIKNDEYELRKKFCGFCRRLRVIPELGDHSFCEAIVLIKSYLKFLKTETCLQIQMKKMSLIQVQLQSLVCQGKLFTVKHSIFRINI